MASVAPRKFAGHDISCPYEIGDAGQAGRVSLIAARNKKADGPGPELKPLF
jgi:hypothetical protein